MPHQSRILAAAVASLLAIACAPPLPAVAPAGAPVPPVPAPLPSAAQGTVPGVVTVPAERPTGATVAPVAAPGFRAQAVFPAGTLIALRNNLRTQTAIPPEDLAVTDLAKLVVAINGVVIPSSDITFEPPRLDALQQIVVTFTVAGRQLGETGILKLSTASGQIVLYGRLVAGTATAVCNIKETAERLIRDQMMALGRQPGTIDPVAIDRITARLHATFISTHTGDPTTTPEMTYAVDVVARRLISGPPIDATTSLDKPASSGGGGTPVAVPAVAPVIAAVVTTLVAGGGFAANPGAAEAASGDLLAVDANGNLYFAAGGAGRKMTAAGVITTMTGSAGLMNDAKAFAVDSTGTLYFTQTAGIVKSITAAGTVATLAGDAVLTGTTDGNGAAARFDGPTAIARDASGTLYVGDTNNNRIRRITSSGDVTTLAAAGGGWVANPGAVEAFPGAAGIAIDSAGNILVSQSDHRIRKVTPAGVVSTLAGSGIATFADGTGTAASFATPKALAADGFGNVYVAEATNRRIRKISSNGVVTIVAGQNDGGIDDATGTDAFFRTPWGLAVSADSATLFVGDTVSSRIRRIR